MSDYYTRESEWWSAALKALAPAERHLLAEPLPGEGRVEHAVRVARTSKRADARRIMLTYLMPAARDGHRAAIETGLLSLDDPSQHVRYEACRLLAVAQDRAALPRLQAMQTAGVEVPYNGIEGSLLAIERGNRDAFFEAQGMPGVKLVLQDEPITSA